MNVAIAPSGAAKLNTMRCARACRFENPCFNSTDVSPKAAGALWIIRARKTTNPVLDSEMKDDAASAIPSAAACITKPIVVEEFRVLTNALEKLSAPSPSSIA